MGRHDGRVALVTGGAQGIGRATAALLESEGATVVIADIQSEPAVDVTRAEDIDALARDIDARYGRLDIAVLNAGRPFLKTTLTATGDDWARCVDLNLKAAWLCARALHPLLMRAERPAIVTIASAQGLRSGRRSFPYSAAKGGLLAMTRSMAVEYAPRIRVNAVIPGQIESVRTEGYFNSFRDPEAARQRTLQSFPLRRLGTPEDVAPVVSFLASDEARYVTGAFLYVDGGRDAAALDLSDLEG